MVQPRERGEHLGFRRRAAGRFGSAPRARGTLRAVCFGSWRRRFSPASAGNTATSRLAVNRLSVQPRERGEHAAGGLMGARQTGSAPRARGTLFQAGRWYERGRFSPASAGNTLRSRGSGWQRAVQPRERGEHGGVGTEITCYFGSAPRARGTPEICTCRAGLRRFSPASAGNTCPALARCRAGAVQPRERGEHGELHVEQRLPIGSAPRARGTLFTTNYEQLPWRFSPASAGNTSSTVSSWP